MGDIRAYILSVTAAAIFCALVTSLVGNGGPISRIVKLMTGVALALVVISPIAKISVGDLDRYLESLEADASVAVNEGSTAARDAMESRITDELEAYILDKAAQLSLNLTVEVELSDDGSMLPAAVILEGDASPYARGQLEIMLQDELGISGEGQIWK